MNLVHRGTFFVRAAIALIISSVFPGIAGVQADPPKAEVLGAKDDPVYVLTQHNDTRRTGANLQETTLNPGNVRPALGGNPGFGKLFTRKVDGHIYAQPLYVQNAPLRGLRRNAVFVVTMHNSVYAFDADDPRMTAPVWKTSLIDEKNGVFACPAPDTGAGDDTIYGNIAREVGITSTPVIDLTTNTLYCTTKTKEISASGAVTYPTRLWALDISTGKPRAGSGVAIAGTVKGTGDGANADGTLTFNWLRHMSRPGLLLNKGVLYIAFGAHADIIPYHGWVFAYDAKTLQQISIWCSTPNGKTDPSGYPLGGGGIWMSGQGLSVDDNDNVYFEVGNGSFSADKGGADYGDSFVKLRLNNKKLEVVDYFAPYNQDWLNRVDADLGVSGPMLIPGTNLMVGGGKEGRLYMVDRAKMGGFRADGDWQIPQWFWSYNGHLHGSPIYWDNANGPLVYLWGEYDRLKSYSFNKKTQQFNSTAAAMSDMYVPWGMPGAVLSLSANGALPSSGIVWASHPYEEDAGGKVVAGIFRAFDAVTLKELWNSKMVADRDDVGTFAKFSPPTIANGRVYLGTFSGELLVYGLGKWAASPVISPSGGEYKKANGPLTVKITCDTPNAAIYYTTDGSDPTTASPKYTGPFQITDSAIVKARALAPPAMPSGIVTAKYLIDDGPGNGDGLTGNYFNRIDLSGPSVTRIDPTIPFRGIGGQSPLPGIGPDNWSARWTGKVQARHTGKYTFTTGSDDGIRLWVNGQLLVDNWTYHGYTENSGTITLTAGQKCDIRLEFFEGGGGADCALMWSSSFWDQKLVPQSQLYSR